MFELLLSYFNKFDVCLYMIAEQHRLFYQDTGKQIEILK